MNDRDTGVDLREIERIQNHKFSQLAFILWSLCMIGLGILLGRYL